MIDTDICLRMQTIKTGLQDLVACLFERGMDKFMSFSLGSFIICWFFNLNQVVMGSSGRECSSYHSTLLWRRRDYKTVGLQVS